MGRIEETGVRGEKKICRSVSHESMKSNAYQSKTNSHQVARTKDRQIE